MARKFNLFREKEALFSVDRVYRGLVSYTVEPNKLSSGQDTKCSLIEQLHNEAKSECSGAIEDDVHLHNSDIVVACDGMDSVQDKMLNTFQPGGIL